MTRTKKPPKVPQQRFTTSSPGPEYMLLVEWGDTHIPLDIMAGMLNVSPTALEDYRIAIEKTQGWIYLVLVTRPLEEGPSSYYFYRLSCYPVPDKYLGRIEELNLKQCPFHLELDGYTWKRFWERQLSIPDLASRFIVALNFKDQVLRLSENGVSVECEL